jgi:uncharacterized membrane protein
MPIGIKIVRIINILISIVSTLIGVLLAALTIPSYIRAVSVKAGHPNPLVMVVIGFIAFLFGAIPAILLVRLNKNLKLLKVSARRWQIGVSCLLLLWVPVGTVLSVIALYFMLIDKKTKEAFLG